MSDSLYIADGYTATKTIPAAPGLHPDVLVQYRPVLARQRAEFQHHANLGPEKACEFEDKLLVKQVVGLNGEPLDADKARRLKPALRVRLLNLVFGYEGEDEATDVKN